MASADVSRRRAMLIQMVGVSEVELEQFVHAHANVLTPREKTALCSFFAIGQDHYSKLRVIGQELGVGDERARQLKDKAARVLASVARNERVVSILPLDQTIDEFFNYGRVDQTETSRSLRVRIINCLINNFYDPSPGSSCEEPKIRQVVQLTEQEILRIPNMGRKGLNAIIAMLATAGLSLGMEFDQ